jgi:RNA 3'-phosphate cyclase
MIELDGTYAEGGGQIVRTALGLSAVTGKAFRVTNIRQGRKEPGLKKQHLEAIRALQKLCNATVEGAELGSKEITFVPGPFKPQKLEIDIETAGSITLLLQSLIVPMTFAKKRTTLVLKGGTDVPWSMPADYFKFVFLPHLKKYADVDFKIIKRGYYPKGNGVVELSVNPKENKQQIILTKQEKLLRVKGIANASASLQKRQVAERMAQAAEMQLQRLDCPISVDVQYAESLSDGAGIVLWSVHSDKDEIDSSNPIILGSDRLGEIHKPAEDVARDAVRNLVEEIRSGAAVDKHCADNLIPFLGIVGGKIKTSAITGHIKANIYVTEQFLDVTFAIDKEKNEISVVKR